MKSTIKFIFTAIGLVLILVGVAAVLVLGQAQDLLTKGVEQVVTEAFGASASVQSIALRPGRRVLVLRKFSLANPEGFAEGDALNCDRIELQIRPASLLRREPIIESISIEGADIHYLFKLGRGTNIGTLAKNLSEKPDGSAATFKVERLTCTDAKVHLSANFMPKNGVTLNVVTINLKNLDEGKPITGAKATSIFLRSVLIETLTLKGLLKPAGKKLRNEVNDLDPDAKKKKSA